MCCDGLKYAKDNDLKASILSKMGVVGDCWMWKGSHSRNYPRIYFEGRAINVVPAVFEIFNGHPCEAGVGHTCGEPLCINPKHLYDRKPHADRKLKIK